MTSGQSLPVGTTGRSLMLCQVTLPKQELESSERLQNPQLTNGRIGIPAYAEELTETRESGLQTITERCLRPVLVQ
jgi:hypothetical protein